jgi:hypothetical protein
LSSTREVPVAPTPPHYTVFSRFATVIMRFAWYQALRLRVIWLHWSLDTELAAGVDPASDPALILRAAQLRSPKHRCRLAASVERLVGEAKAPRLPALTVAVPVVREPILEARDSLLFLAYLLRHADRLPPRGVAMVQRLLTDGGSVLYTDTARGAVELQVETILDCLVDHPDPTPEAWFSVCESESRDPSTLPISDVSPVQDERSDHVPRHRSR